MLLITRRTGEAIVINGTIEVKVLEVKGGRVKLGFEYPVGSSVFRQELFEKIQAENKAAALGKVANPGALRNVVQNLQPLGQGTPAVTPINEVEQNAHVNKPGKPRHK
jgi:carbon storage regulator